MGNAGADANLATIEGATPLIVASQKGHLGVLTALAGFGADIGHAAHNGATSLVMACITGHDGAVEFLLAKGADPANTFRGESAHSLATQRGHIAVAKLIETALAE